MSTRTCIILLAIYGAVFAWQTSFYHCEPSREGCYGPIGPTIVHLVGNAAHAMADQWGKI